MDLRCYSLNWFIIALYNTSKPYHPSELYVLLQNTHVLTQQSLYALPEVFSSALEQELEEVGQVLSEVELGRTVLQENEVLLRFVVAFLSIVVELEHCRHVAGAALLVFPVRQPANPDLLFSLLLLLLEFLQFHRKTLLLHL